MKKTLLLLTLGLATYFGKAQNINHFTYNLETNQYGNVDLVIKPTYGIPSGDDCDYGVRVCYTINGEKKGNKWGMKYKLKSKGEFNVYLGNSNHTINIMSVEFFHLSTPYSEQPQREDCN